MVPWSIGTRMEWSVLATFAGVLVAAAGAASAIVREQSLIRQLERVTAVLTDVREGSPGYDHLVVVRADLARRFNETYRAPRHWGRAFAGWTLRVAAALALVLTYVYVFTGLYTLMPRNRPVSDYSGSDWLELGGLFGALAVGVFIASGLVMWGRSERRRKWLNTHGPEEADRPSV